MYCGKCGHKVLDNARFCQYCGADLELQRKAMAQTELPEQAAEPEPDPEQLSVIERARQNDDDAFRDLMLATRGKATMTARYYFHDEDMVKEAVQKAYIKAFRNLNHLQDDSKFQPWLNSIVINECKNILKSAEYRHTFAAAETEDEDGNDIFDYQADMRAASPQEQMDEAERKQVLMSILQSLPQDQLIVTSMYFYEQKKIDEIATELDVNRNTVASRLKYAKQKIRDSVLAYENREGVMLHVAAPLPFFVWLLRSFNTTDASLLGGSATAAATAAAAASAPENAAGSSAEANTGSAGTTKEDVTKLNEADDSSFSGQTATNGETSPEQQASDGAPRSSDTPVEQTDGDTEPDDAGENNPEGGSSSSDTSSPVNDDQAQPQPEKGEPANEDTPKSEDTPAPDSQSAPEEAVPQEEPLPPVEPQQAVDKSASSTKPEYLQEVSGAAQSGASGSAGVSESAAQVIAPSSAAAGAVAAAGSKASFSVIKLVIVILVALLGIGGILQVTGAVNIYGYFYSVPGTYYLDSVVVNGQEISNEDFDIALNGALREFEDARLILEKDKSFRLTKMYDGELTDFAKGTWYKSGSEVVLYTSSSEIGGTYMGLNFLGSDDRFEIMTGGRLCEHTGNVLIGSVEVYLKKQ